MWVSVRIGLEWPVVSFQIVGRQTNRAPLARLRCTIFSRVWGRDSDLFALSPGNASAHHHEGNEDTSHRSILGRAIEPRIIRITLQPGCRKVFPSNTIGLFPRMNAYNFRRGYKALEITPSLSEREKCSLTNSRYHSTKETDRWDASL